MARIPYPNFDDLSDYEDSDDNSNDNTNNMIKDSNNNSNDSLSDISSYSSDDSSDGSSDGPIDYRAPSLHFGGPFLNTISGNLPLAPQYFNTVPTGRSFTYLYKDQYPCLTNTSPRYLVAVSPFFAGACSCAHCGLEFNKQVMVALRVESGKFPLQSQSWAYLHYTCYRVIVPESRISLDHIFFWYAGIIGTEIEDVLIHDHQYISNINNQTSKGTTQKLPISQAKLDDILESYDSSIYIPKPIKRRRMNPRSRPSPRSDCPQSLPPTLRHQNKLGEIIPNPVTELKLLAKKEKSNISMKSLNQKIYTATKMEKNRKDAFCIALSKWYNKWKDIEVPNLDPEAAPLCLMCKDAPVEVSYQPCAHVCYCRPCDRNILFRDKKCPICRSVPDSNLLIRRTWQDKRGKEQSHLFNSCMRCYNSEGQMYFLDTCGHVFCGKCAGFSKCVLCCKDKRDVYPIFFP